MKEVLLQVLTLAYAFVGVVSIFAYWPTLKDLYDHKPSANIKSYLVWTMTSFVSFLYSIFLLSDWLILFIFGINFIFCVVVVLLVFRIKKMSKIRDIVI